MIVPAVTEVSFPQAAHSQLARRRFSSQPLSWPQAGQTKPSGQRLAARCRAQEASSGKRASKAARDMGQSYFQRLAMTEHYTNILPTPARNSTSRQTGLKGISPYFNSCLSMKLSKAAETQRMSHRGFQSLCHIRVRTGNSRLRRPRGLRHEQERIGERTFMDKQVLICARPAGCPPEPAGSVHQQLAARHGRSRPRLRQPITASAPSARSG